MGSLNGRVNWARASTLTLVLAGQIVLSAPVMATSSGAIAQSYTAASASIAEGTLLSLTAADSGTVELAQAGTNAVNLVGVAAQSPLVELSDASAGSAQVVVGGSTLALVSDINGPIAVGDKITDSPLAGIGMKATESGEIVGVAQASLNSVTTQTKSVSSKNGRQVSVKVGLVPVAVSPAYYSVPQVASLSGIVPPALQTAADSLTGHPVSPIRVLVATLALLVGLVIAVVMLATSIRSEIVSLGRNPLARNSLLRGLVDVLIAAAGILLVTLATAVALVWTS